MERVTISRMPYENGRWGTNHAAVIREEDGTIIFSNGYADGAVMASEAEALARLRSFIIHAHRPYCGERPSLWEQG